MTFLKIIADRARGRCSALYDRRMHKAMLFLLLALAPCLQAQTFDELRPQVRAAIEAKDYPRLTSVLEQMNRIRPDHPNVLANLASVYALTARADASVAAIERLLAMKTWIDLGDSDFDAVRSDASFVAAAKRMDALRGERIGDARVAFTIPQKGLITEGLAIDAGGHAMYVSSARKGRIVRVDRHGRVRDLTSDTGLHGLSGIGIDAKRKVLWACSTASPRVEGFQRGDANDASLVAFDIGSGKVLRRVPFPDAQSFCDDVTVTSDGTVYASDSSGAVLKLVADATAVETLVPRGKMRSPQGSVLSANGRILYVADYGGPIRAVDLVTGDVAPLRAPADVQLLGIDGLTRWKRSLVAVQNGIEPHRVLRLDLSADGLAIERASILSMNDPLMNEPTIGKVVGNTYYLVGTSEGNKFDRGTPDEATLSEGRIFAIRLE